MVVVASEDCAPASPEETAERAVVATARELQGAAKVAAHAGGMVEEQWVAGQVAAMVMVEPEAAAMAAAAQAEEAMVVEAPAEVVPD